MSSSAAEAMATPSLTGVPASDVPYSTPVDSNLIPTIPTSAIEFAETTNTSLPNAHSWRNDKLLPLTLVLALLLLVVSFTLAFVLLRHRKARLAAATNNGPWCQLTSDPENPPQHYPPFYHHPRPIRTFRPAFNKRDFLPPFSMFRSGEKHWHAQKGEEATGGFMPEEAGMRDCACCRHNHTGHTNPFVVQGEEKWDEKKGLGGEEVRWESVRERGVSEEDMEVTEIRLESPPKSPPPVYTVLR